MVETDFATKVRALMRRIKISQADLAPILGVTQGRVSQLLRAREIKLSHAMALARLFDVSLDYLANPSIPVRSENELNLERDIRDLIARLGPERAYNRMILMERAEVTQYIRPSGLPADGVHGPEKPVLAPPSERAPTLGARKSRQKPNQ